MAQFLPVSQVFQTYRAKTHPLVFKIDFRKNFLQNSKLSVCLRPLRATTHARKDSTLFHGKQDAPDEEILKLELRLAQIEAREGARNDFLSFVRYVWPSFICGEHHKIMAKKFQELVHGDLKRVVINIAPRHGKSELTSYLFLAWLMGQKPDSKIIQATHTGELAQRFGRKVRNLMDSEEYKQIFPEVLLATELFSHLAQATKQLGEDAALHADTLCHRASCGRGHSKGH